MIESLHDAIRDDDELTARLDEFMMGRIFWQLGRLDTAARWFRDTHGGAELHGPKSLRELALCFLAIVAAEQGDLEQARRHRARVIDGLDADSSATALADAWIAVLEGRPDAAAATILARVDVIEPRGAASVAAGLLHQLVRFGARTHARAAAERLARLAEASDSPAVRRRLAHAQRGGRRRRIRPARGRRRVGVDRPPALRGRGVRVGRAGGTRRTGGDARPPPTCNGRRPSPRRARVRAPRCCRFSQGAEPLTPREREIASLAAQGLSSNEIATRLFLSPRTVNNHLQSTYAKLGIRGRHELQV